MTPLLSDVRLARQASEGDRRAFEAIFARYHQDLYRFCLSILGRPEDAQDALQNTMVKALRALPGERREIQLKPWLYRVAHNEAIDLLRRRREGPELEDAQMAAGAEIAETVALRERLGRLLADLGQLSERQRSALVMRELGGLDYEQIGEAFESSSAVARQTVYEARLALRELEAGREMSCDQVTRQLSEADGRVRRRRDLKAHLRACPDCRAFRDSIDERRRDLHALSPLPAAAAASILHGLVGGKVAAGGLSGAATAAGAGAGKAAGTSMAVKAMATAAVVATVGITAADRSGVVDVGLPGDDRSPSSREAPTSGSGEDSARPTTKRGVLDGVSAQGRRAAVGAAARAKQGGSGHSRAAAGSPTQASTPAQAERGTAKPATLPAASSHGQETAAAHKAGGRGKAKGKATAHPSPSSHSNSGGSKDGAKGAKSTAGKSNSTGQGKNQGGETRPAETHPAPVPAAPPGQGKEDEGVESRATPEQGETGEPEPTS